jgi:F420H(2)-dependent quinone reductase
MRLSGTGFARRYAQAHTIVYRLSGGRLGARIWGAVRNADPPVLLLSTTGRRTGKVRTTPLIFLRAGEELVIAAANAGHRDHPAWWRNLRADPRAAVQIGERCMAVVASEVTDSRRTDLWMRFVEFYPPLAEYQLATARPIPLVALRRDVR